jgi:hypothetical protein
MSTGKLLPTGLTPAHPVVILEAPSAYSPWQSASTIPISGTNPGINYLSIRRIDKMNKVFAFFLVVFCFSCCFIHAADRAVLVHNTTRDIENCKGKLQLKLIRIWGGHEEEDENKFFETPISVSVDDRQLVYICDCHIHCVKAFSNTGKYVRTIGRKGQGPGDLYGPTYITLSPGGDLLVNETGNQEVFP